MFVNVHLLAFTEGTVRRVKVPLEKDLWEKQPVDSTLDDVFYWGQNDHQEMEMPSVSMGDVAELFGRRWLCCSVGWQRSGHGI